MKQDIITFGCRLNAYESEVIRQGITDAGMDNVAVFNTCAVTREAERQARQAIRKYCREHPDARIIVTGCSAQINPDQYAALPEVDKVIGNDEKMNPETYEKMGFITDTERIVVNDIMAVKETAGHLITGLEGHARAFMQVQNGCDHRCTFCIIPYGRGNSRSVPMGEIVKQGQALVEAGYQEIVLTGVDISSYGGDLPGTPALGTMIKRFLKLVPDLKRLRLSSIDVAEIDTDLLDLLANEPRLMPHLHLSLQAGDDMILKRMKRRHTRQQAIDFCEQARRLRPDVVFGADMIAGFPTESEAMFENTLRMVEEAGLIHLHVFPYSEREGTPAASIPQSKQVPVAIRKERSKKLIAAGKTQLYHHLNRHIGHTEKVVVEQGNIGHTEQFLQVKLAQPYPIGTLQQGMVDSTEGDYLLENA